MFILHIISEKTWRGGEQQIAYLLQGSRQRDHQIFVICRANSAFERYCQAENIPYETAFFSFEWDLITAWKIARFVKKNKIDLIHVHSGKSHGLAVLAQFFTDLPFIIVSRRIPRPGKGNFFARWKYLHRKVAKIVGVSPAITCMMKHYLADPKRCMTIFSGVDIKNFISQGRLEKIYPRREGCLRFITVAALVWHKGLFTLIEAFELAIAAGLDIDLVIVGGGPLETALEKTILEKKLADRIYLLGEQPQAKALIVEADVFILTSNEEGLGTSILDAMVAKRPVIATMTGGIPAMIENGKTGLLAPVGDSDAIAEAIKKMYLDAVLRQEIAVAAYEKVCQAFSCEKMVEETLALYNTVIST